MSGAFFSKQSFLFDLDGTLIDSTAAHARAYSEALRPGYPHLAEKFVYERVAGWPTREAFISLGMHFPELEILTRRKQEIYREALGRGEVRLFPQAEKLLARLQKAGKKNFLVTGASRISVDRILAMTGLDQFFIGIITAEDAARGKPSPEPYRAALAKFSLEIRDCLVIEDGASGVQSAQAAGLEVILVNTDLRIAGVEHFGDCANLLRAMFP